MRPWIRKPRRTKREEDGVSQDCLYPGLTKHSALGRPAWNGYAGTPRNRKAPNGSHLSDACSYGPLLLFQPSIAHHGQPSVWLFPARSKPNVIWIFRDHHGS